MTPTSRRVLGYGGALALTGALIWLGFGRQVDPDLMTMVSSVEVQLQMAAAMPAKGENGEPIEERELLIATAKDYLARIDRQRPDFPPSVEFHAFLAYLDGDYAVAAQLYRGVRQLEDCTPEQSDYSVLNEARMLQLGGDRDAARLLVSQEREEFTPEVRVLADRLLGDGPAPATEAAAGPATEATPAPAQAAVPGR